MSTEVLPARARAGLVLGEGLRLNLALALAVLVFAALSLLTGAAGQGGPVASAQVAGLDAELARILFLEIRLPRMLLALTSGMVLGLAGAALQGFLRNPLAEPGLVGASSGAALGAVLVFYFGVFGSALIALPIGGMIGALIALALLFALAGSRPDLTTLILAGVAINAAANALTSLALNLAPNPFAAYEIMFWLMGSVADRSLAHVYAVLPFFVLGTLMIWASARSLDALALGDEVAESLGIDLRRLRLLVIGGSGLAVGAAVSVTGMIGFVGLIVPHLVRPFVGHEPSRTLLPSALAGGALLLAADIAVRLMPLGTELKLGVLTALVGGPFFLFLVLRMRRGLS